MEKGSLQGDSREKGYATTSIKRYICFWLIALFYFVRIFCTIPHHERKG